MEAEPQVLVERRLMVEAPAVKTQPVASQAQQTPGVVVVGAVRSVVGLVARAWSFWPTLIHSLQLQG